MIANLKYNDLECLEYFPIATYFFKLNIEQYNSLKFIQESLLHKKYIDIDDNFMYLRFIVSDWFSKLNLNNKFEIANFINKLNLTHKILLFYFNLFLKLALTYQLST